MGTTGTITVLFTDIVGSTDHLVRLGDRAWDEVRREHFAALREALEAHGGDEVKNTGDGLMAVFRSAAGAVDCAVAMQRATRRVIVHGSPVGVRIGVAAGEATEEHGDWFGTPVVEAARLCATAEPGQSWATTIVPALVGSRTEVVCTPIGAKDLKGFDRPIEVVRIESADDAVRTGWASVDERAHDAAGFTAQLDYWDALPTLRRMRDGVDAAIAAAPGDVVADIGCGTGSELIRLAHAVGATGRAIGIDVSTVMLDETRRRAEQAGVTVELLAVDGRGTGLPDGACDAVRIERVLQHIGDVPGFLAEARRITRPGGRIALADTDWGSLMIGGADRELVRRLKAAVETGPWADPWIGRGLHGALLRAGFVDVRTEMYAVAAGPGITEVTRPVFEALVERRLATRAEVDDLIAGLEAALEQGEPAFAFTMFVSSGRVPG